MPILRGCMIPLAAVALSLPGCLAGSFEEAIELGLGPATNRSKDASLTQSRREPDATPIASETASQVRPAKADGTSGSDGGASTDSSPKKFGHVSTVASP